MTNPQGQRRLPNFAPLSGANSTELRLASGYFVVSGILTILILCVTFVAGLFVVPGFAASVSMDIATIVFSIIGLLVIASVWNELR